MMTRQFNLCAQTSHLIGIKVRGDFSRSHVARGHIELLFKRSIVPRIVEEYLTKTKLASKLQTRCAALDYLLDPENTSVTLYSFGDKFDVILYQGPA